MKKDLFLWQFTGLTFTAVLGTLSHFLYEWTGILAFAPFCAVNESTWEHMKILFFPMLLFAFIQFPFFRKETANFWKIKLIGITLGTLLIPVLFYTIIGAFGVSPDWVNISIFFLSAGIAYAVESQLFKTEKQTAPSVFWKIAPLILLVLFSLAFIAFTFYPPTLPLFKDPLSGGYGLIPL